MGKYVTLPNNKAASFLSSGIDNLRMVEYLLQERLYRYWGQNHRAEQSRTGPVLLLSSAGKNPQFCPLEYQYYEIS
jgi:hypothetical protein